MALTFCLAEDRITEDTALRLVLLSLRKHQPEATVFLFRPQPSSSFREWLWTFPSVVLVPHFPEGALGWNCKPQVLLDVRTAIVTASFGLIRIFWSLAGAISY